MGLGGVVTVFTVLCVSGLPRQVLGGPAAQPSSMLRPACRTMAPPSRRWSRSGVLLAWCSGQVSQQGRAVVQDEVLDPCGLEVVSGEFIQRDPFQLVAAPVGVGVFVARPQRRVDADQSGSEEVLHRLTAVRG